MGSLFDELRKAKLINEKDAKRLQHEKRVTRKKKGGHAAEKKEEEQKRVEFEARKAREAEENRQRAEAQQASQADKERASRLVNIVETSVFRGRWGGQRAFHFVARNKEIWKLEVDPGVGRQLESGEIALCEKPGSQPIEIVLIKGSVIAKIRELDPSLVRFYGPDFDSVER